MYRPRGASDVAPTPTHSSHPDTSCIAGIWVRVRCGLGRRRSDVRGQAGFIEARADSTPVERNALTSSQEPTAATSAAPTIRIAT